MPTERRTLHPCAAPQFHYPYSRRFELGRPSHSLSGNAASANLAALRKFRIEQVRLDDGFSKSRYRPLDAVLAVHRVKCTASLAWSVPQVRESFSATSIAKRSTAKFAAGFIRSRIADSIADWGIGDQGLDALIGICWSGAPPARRLLAFVLTFGTHRDSFNPSNFFTGYG